MSEIIINNVEKNEEVKIEVVKIKKPMSEALKRAQAKYYEKIKGTDILKERNRKSAKKTYDSHKDDPEFKKYNYGKLKKHREKLTDNPEYKDKQITNGEIINEKQREYHRERYYNKKVKDITSKLEELGIEELAKILVANKKTKILS